jgi:hypothetical protein
MDRDGALRNVHLAAGLFHAGQAMAISVLLRNSKREFSFSETAFGKQVYRSSSTHLQHLVVLFPTLSAINHAESVINWENYLVRLETTGGNWVRWAEYSVSAGVMLFVISQLSGVESPPLLLSIVAANAAMQFTGHMIETTGDPEAGFTAIGYAMFLGIWTPIVWSFISTVSFDDEDGVDDKEDVDDDDEEGFEADSLPVIVYFIVVVQIVFFMSFGIVSSVFRRRQLQGSKRNRVSRVLRPSMSDLRKREMWYAGLSLVSKSALTWMIYGGVLNAGND